MTARARGMQLELHSDSKKITLLGLDFSSLLFSHSLLTLIFDLTFSSHWFQLRILFDLDLVRSG